MGSIMTSCERECMIAAVDKAASEYQREINFFRSAAHREVLVPPHNTYQLFANPPHADQILVRAFAAQAWLR